MNHTSGSASGASEKAFIRKLKEKLLLLKPNLASAILPTIVVTLVFFLNYFCFGMDNTMIAPFVTLSFLRFRNISNHYECMCKTWLIYVIMTLLAFVAVINLPLCIIVNAVALFWLAYTLIDEYNPTNYFPAGMALIFFQIAPAHTLQALGIRLLALSASLGIVLAFVIVLFRKKGAHNPVCRYIREGLANCEAQLSAYRKYNMQALEKLHHELCVINKKICDEIYTYNRASIRLAGKINWYCRYVALFQVINYFTTKTFDMEDYIKISSILNRFSRQFETARPTSDYKRLNFKNDALSLKAFRFRFAMRLVLVVTPCLTFAYLTSWENSYWLVISVFFMMIPVTEFTKQRISQRVTGTMLGIILCFLLFSLFQDLPGRFLVMTLANFMIYASNSYGVTVIYITCSALAMQSLDASVSIMLLQRLGYTVLGGIITLLANHFVFPIRTRKEMVILIGRLNTLQRQLTALSPESCPDPDKRQYIMDGLIIKSYMLMKRLQTYHSWLPPEQQNDAFVLYEQKYMTFMGEYLEGHLLESIPL